MRSLLAGLTALPFVAGFALAAQPVPLNDVQMDGVTAGFTAMTQPDTQASGKIVASVTPTPTPTPTPTSTTNRTSSVDGLTIQGGFTSVFSPTPAPTPTPTPAFAWYNPPCDCNLTAPPPPPPPPTPTQQFSSLLSSNGIGLR